MNLAELLRKDLIRQIESEMIGSGEAENSFTNCGSDTTLFAVGSLRSCSLKNASFFLKK